jgi:Domain of unknown function (DUF892)
VVLPATTNAVGLAEEVFAIAERLLGILVNGDRDGLDVLVAVAFPGLSIGHFQTPFAYGTASRELRPIAIIAKGAVEYGIFTKEIKSMEDLLIHGLQDIYYAEQQIIKSLPKMIDKATNRDLVAGLNGHLEETNKQIERLQNTVGVTVTHGSSKVGGTTHPRAPSRSHAVSKNRCAVRNCE